MNLKRLFLYTLIASVAVSAVIGIVVILIGSFGEFETKVLLTTTTITVTSILGLACGAFLETGRGRILPLTGIGFATVSAIMWIVLIWQGTIQNDAFVKSLMSATLLAASCAHISLLSLARLEKKFAWSMYAVHASVWSLAAVLMYFIWTNGEINEEIMGRVTGVLGIVIASLTVITPVFHKLSRPEGGSELNAIDAEIKDLKGRIAGLEEKRRSMQQ